VFHSSLRPLRARGLLVAMVMLSFSLGMLRRGFVFGLILVFVWACYYPILCYRMTRFDLGCLTLLRGFRRFSRSGVGRRLRVIWFSAWTDQVGRGHIVLQLLLMLTHGQSHYYFVLLLLLYVINLYLIVIKYVLF
jgi:hypothetical protein